MSLKTNMGKMIGRAILCAIFGLIGWIVTEPLMPKNFASSEWQIAEYRMLIVTMLCISLAAGFHQGYMKGGTRNILLGLGLGTIFGSIGGLLGYQIGGGITTAIFGPGWPTSGFAIVPRTITFAILGTGLGTGIGLTQFKTRIIMAGAFGGLIGGGIAGFFFDPIGQIIAVSQYANAAAGQSDEIGYAGRAVMFPLIGFCVGLFTAWLEQATRQAWVRLILGRNEGKEWPIDGAQTHLGRDERAHIPLFGDNNVAPLHATIIRQGHQYILHDAGSPIGTGYQGVRMAQPVALMPGDTFQIGPHQLQFLTKASAAQRIHEGRAHAVPVGPAQPATPLQPVTIPGAQPQTSNPGRMPGFTLVALDGPLTGQRIPINATTEAGRDTPGLNLGFDAQASRRHAQLTPTPHGLQVTDLGSTNGTFLNGQRIPEAIAPSGSVIKIGSTSFRVEPS